MGVTNYDIELLNKYIGKYGARSVIELGAQNNYAQPSLPAPYMREWYEQQGITYDSIDLSAEDGCIVKDLSTFCMYNHEPRDLVTDFGTSEHVGLNGVFNWKAIHNCWCNKFVLCKPNGLIISENPMTSNWRGHGFNYYTHQFYLDLAQKADLRILELTSEAATGNNIDGWNVVCVMQRYGDKFPTLEEFMTFDLRQE